MASDSRSPEARREWSRRETSLSRTRSPDMRKVNNSPPSRSRTPSSRGRPASMRNGERQHHSRSPSRGFSRSRSRSSTRHRGGSRRSYSRSRSRSRSQTPASQNAKIVVERLTKNVVAGHLQEIFEQYGRIVELDMPIHPGFNMNRGIAYIVFDTTESAESAVAHMHEGWVDGEQLSVSIVLPRKRWSRSPPLRRLEPIRRGPPSGPPPFRDGRGDGDRSQHPRNAYRERDYDGHHSYRGDRGAPVRDPPGGYYSPPRRRSPPPQSRHAGSGSYRNRSYSRSRSPPPRRGRSWSRGPSRSYRRSRSPSRSRTRSRSKSPAQGRRAGAGQRPPRDSGRRRSPSYDSYSSYSSRSRSRDRGGRR